MRLISKMDLKFDKFIKSVNMEGLRYIGDPIKTAKKYEANGLDELIVEDCVSSWFGQEPSYDTLRNIAKSIFIPLTFGGGIKCLDTAEKAFENGADKITLNTHALEKPILIDNLAKKYGSQSVSINIQIKKIKNKWKIYKCFGREIVDINVYDWIDNVISRGAGEIILTSIDYDGTLKGIDEKLVDFIDKKKISIPILYSGGIRNNEDINRIMKKNYFDGILISSAFHYKKLDIETVKKIKKVGR